MTVAAVLTLISPTELAPATARSAGIEVISDHCKPGTASTTTVGRAPGEALAMSVGCVDDGCAETANAVGTPATSPTPIATVAHASHRVTLTGRRE